MTDHLDTPRPLGILKQIPPMSPSPLKRASSMLESSPKRVRISSDFKKPATPARALTPSTSTAAYSSSPRVAVSSPPRRVRIFDAPMEPVRIETGLAIVFGRHRSNSSTGTTTLRSSVPSHLRHLVADLEAPASIVYLPRSAKHASRVHAVAEYMEDSDLVRVTVIGQNGLRVDGRRILPGQRFDLKRRDEAELSFYGASVRLEFPGVSRERLFTPSEGSEVYEAPTPESSLPPSSPDRAERRASTPLSEQAPEAPVEETRQPSVEEKRQPSSPKLDPEVDTSLPLPTGIDLPALLASTVVFSGSSKLSLPDLVKHMLESQPSLRIHAGEPQWEFWCGSALDANAMFGKVQRHGKDSSGRPLLPHYFYAPDLDTDVSRAKELGGLVRPLRTVQRAGGKAIDWRPVGGGRRR